MKRFLFILLLIAQFAHATSYYVATAGLSTNSGTTDTTPWNYAKAQTFAFASSDIIYFNRGDTFQGTFHNPRNGVTIDAYGTGANPVFTGFSTLTGWTLLSGNIYYVPMTFGTGFSMLNMVTFDGAVQQMARYPRTTYAVYTSSSGNASITGPALGFDPTGGQVVNRKERWIIDRNPITSYSVSGSNGTINYSTDNNYGNNGIYSPTNGNGYFVQNCAGACNQEGDWYIDAVNHRFCMYFSDSPTSHVIQASTNDAVIYINGAHNFTIQNVDITGGSVYGVQLQSDSVITINNVNLKQQGGTAIFLAVTTQTTINNSTCTDTYNNCVDESYSDTKISITNCTFTNNGIIRGTGVSGDGSQSCLDLSGDYETVTNCFFINTGYCAVSFDGGANHIYINNNFINYYCLTHDDGGALYTYNGNTLTPVADRIVSNNLVFNGTGAYDGGVNSFSAYEAYGLAAGFYFDNNANHTHLVNNTFINGQFAGIFLHDGSSNLISGNTVYNFKQEQFSIVEDVTNSIRTDTVNNNTFIVKGPAPFGLYVETTFADPPANFGPFTNNIYARPVAETNTISYNKNYSGLGTTNMSLATYQSTYSTETGSVKSAFAITDTSTFRLDYNQTLSAINVTLPQYYRDVSANVYSPGTVILAALKAEILLPYTLPLGKAVFKLGGRRLIFPNGRQVSN